jgi:hypothetical protein
VPTTARRFPRPVKHDFSSPGLSGYRIPSRPAPPLGKLTDLRSVIQICADRIALSDFGGRIAATRVPGTPGLSLARWAAGPTTPAEFVARLARTSLLRFPSDSLFPSIFLPQETMPAPGKPLEENHRRPAAPWQLSPPKTERSDSNHRSQSGTGAHRFRPEPG